MARLPSTFVPAIRIHRPEPEPRPAAEGERGPVIFSARVFRGRTRASEPTTNIERWFLSVCYPYPSLVEHERFALVADYMRNIEFDKTAFEWYIGWVPNTLDGPLLASVDAEDDAVSLYPYRDGAFVRIGRLMPGDLPAQIIAAELNGDGIDDLVVRNAGDGTLSVFFPRTFTGPIGSQSDLEAFLPPVTLPVNGTLISGAGSANPLIQSFATGGDSPTTGFAGDFSGNGFTDLVVGNNGDGHLALLLGGSSGLTLSQSLFSAAAPNPTGLSFGGSPTASCAFMSARRGARLRWRSRST